MQFLFSAGLIVYRYEESTALYLLLKYPHGHWDFPKGKIEKGEDLQEAAMRELKEETGLSAEIIPGFNEEFEYFFKQEEKLIKKKVTFFIAKADQETVKLSFEHIDYAWLPYDRAVEQLTFDNARQVLKKANNFLM